MAYLSEPTPPYRGSRVCFTFWHFRKKKKTAGKKRSNSSLRAATLPRIFDGLVDFKLEDDNVEDEEATTTHHDRGPMKYRWRSMLLSCIQQSTQSSGSFSSVVRYLKFKTVLLRSFFIAYAHQFIYGAPLCIIHYFVFNMCLECQWTWVGKM